jgi:hypothetical protein
VYRELIGPAIEAARLQPIRADEEMSGGLIHKAMFERLVLCEYAVADLTTANANVFYELGVRHAARPFSTVLLFADRGRLPFDLSPMRAIPYQLTDEGAPRDAAGVRRILAERLDDARRSRYDSPVFQLVDGLAPAIVPHERTDVFRTAQYSAQMKDKLADARDDHTGRALRAIEAELEPIRDREAGIIVDLFLSYRAIQAWDAMIALVERMPEPLAQSVMVQEQLALALNRAGRGERAERVLLDLIKRRGPSSETYGILGRVYKDRWEAARRQGATALAQGLIGRAIDAYLKGFESDWRDAYPGVNAVTLMEISDPPDARRLQLLPVVQYAVERKIAAGRADYWDHASIVELSVVARNRDRAHSALGEALAAVREPWEPETTARNVRLICEARERRGELEPWMTDVHAALAGAARATPAAGS